MKGKQNFDGTIDGAGYKTRMDSGKPSLGMIPPSFTIGVAEVLTHGAQKYSTGNWMRGMSFSDIADAIESHLSKWKLGQELDDDSGLPHLHHAACGLAFLSWYQHGPRAAEYAQFDDRLFKPPARQELPMAEPREHA